MAIHCRHADNTDYTCIVRNNSRYFHQQYIDVLHSLSVSATYRSLPTLNIYTDPAAAVFCVKNKVVSYIQIYLILAAPLQPVLHVNM